MRYKWCIGVPLKSVCVGRSVDGLNGVEGQERIALVLYSGKSLERLQFSREASSKPPPSVPEPPLSRPSRALIPLGDGLRGGGKWEELSRPEGSTMQLGCFTKALLGLKPSCATYFWVCEGPRSRT